MRILVVENNAAPYRDDTFLELKNSTGCKFRIITERRPGINDNHAEWCYESPLEKYRSYSAGTRKIGLASYRKGVVVELKKYKPDVLLTSSYIEGVLAKIISRSRVVLMSDTIKKGRHGARLWNKLLLSALYRIGDAMWVPGEAAAAYYREYLGQDRPIYQGGYTNDARRQYQAIRSWQSSKSQLRAGIGIGDEDFVVLFIGKLISSRCVHVLLEAAVNLEQRVNRVKFLIIGDGPDMKKVNDYLRKHKNLVHIDEVPLHELEKYYAIADAYVHPGEEPYSLALYEAAVAGIPIIASVKVGATKDCLRDRENGYLFEFGNSTDLAKKLELITKKNLCVEKIKQVQQLILSRRGITWSANQLAQACGWIEEENKQ